jgi:hypothetical protein
MTKKRDWQMTIVFYLACISVVVFMLAAKGVI